MKALVLALSFGLLCSQNVFAWGWQAHSITAVLAQKILQDDPSPEAKTALATVKSILGGTSIDRAATWADQVKDQARACKADPYDNKEICDAYRATSAWHFVTTDDLTYKYNPASSLYNNGDLYVITRILAHQLAGTDDATIIPSSYTKWLEQCQQKSDHPCKKEALQFLIHYVGDLHQPLHTGSDCDGGGNGQYIVFFGKDKESPAPPYCKGREAECANFELHAIWDSRLMLTKTPTTRIPFSSFENYSDQLYSWLEPKNLQHSSDAAQCVKVAPNAAADLNAANFPGDWINESLCYIPQAYTFPDDNSMSPPGLANRCRMDHVHRRKVGDKVYQSFDAFPLAQKYYDVNMTTINERLFWTGHRLASLLKQIYGHGDKSKAFTR